MRIRITSAAKADIAGALTWYRERGAGLDRRFLSAFDQSLSAIQKHAEIAPKIEGEVRRFLMRGFPYAVFYLANQREIIVLACLHGARAPEGWPGSGAV